MNDTQKFQTFIQKNNGQLIPTGNFMTVTDWENSNPSRQFDIDTLHNPNKYHSFVQIDNDTKIWFLIGD
ncbi:MAG: hypothetical protein KC589_03270 [Nanoarchaeota archaeon]|nr:hypothetical protein [Nanoarchaeota archaeon]